MKYTFYCEYGDGTKITFEGSKEVLDEVAEDFADWLRAVGFADKSIDALFK